MAKIDKNNISVFLGNFSPVNKQDQTLVAVRE